MLMPVNQTTGKPYRGGNALYLMITALEKGYVDPRWMTYKQSAEKNWQVRRGEKGTPIEFWDFARRTAAAGETSDADESEKDTPDHSRRSVLHRIYTVFNAEQIDGAPPYPTTEREPIEVIDTAERILTHSGADIRHDQIDKAFYTPRADVIHLPRRDFFKDAPGYYSTALHELAHWTGHPDRLNRPTLTEFSRFGDPSYAKEELRAELASLFLAAERGIPHDPAQHAAYVSSWIKALQDDKHEIFRAAHDASAAADYLLDLERAPKIADNADLPADAHAQRVRQPHPSGHHR